MLVFVGGLPPNYDKFLTTLRHNLVDENPKLSKTHPAGREAAPWVYFAKLGFSSTKCCESVVKVLPHGLVEVLSETSDKRQALKYMLP